MWFYMLPGCLLLESQSDTRLLERFRKHKKSFSQMKIEPKTSLPHEYCVQQAQQPYWTQGAHKKDTSRMYPQDQLAPSVGELGATEHLVSTFVKNVCDYDPRLLISNKHISRSFILLLFCYPCWHCHGPTPTTTLTLDCIGWRGRKCWCWYVL